MHRLDEVQAVYTDPADDPWDADVVPVLRVAKRAQLAAAIGVSARSIKAYLNGHSRPQAARRAQLVALAVREARRLARLRQVAPELREAAGRLLAREEQRKAL